MKDVQFELFGKHFSVRTDNEKKLNECVVAVRKLVSKMNSQNQIFDNEKLLLYCLLQLSDQLVTANEELDILKNNVTTIDTDIDSILED